MENIKKFILFAIVPAIVAGAFTIAPKIYDEFTRPKANLIYEFSTGPAVQSDGHFQRIYSFDIKNDGSKALLDVVGILNLEDGKIKQVTEDMRGGLNPQLSVKGGKSILSIQSLHPTERYSFSLLVEVPSKDIVPLFELRSREVLGKLKTENDEGTLLKKYGDIWPAVASGTMVFIILVQMLRGRPVPIIGGMASKRDTLVYISALIGLPSISEVVHADSSLPTYIRTSDLILALGNTEDQEVREKCIKALKCILLIKGINESSLSAIINNLRFLEGEYFSGEIVEFIRKKSIDIDDVQELRTTITKFVDDETTFLTS